MPACAEQWNELLSCALDGEARPAELERLERHLSECPSCAEAGGEYLGVRWRLEGLRGRGRTDRFAPAASRSTRTARARWRWGSALVGALAAVLVFAGGLAGAPGWTRWADPAESGSLTSQAERHHYEAFAQGDPCEFRSASPRAVAHWLHSQVGYAVDVPELPGAKLLGARHCTLEGAPTASILYRRGGVGITLFVPETGSAAAEATLRFAGGDTHCTLGRKGDRICAARAGPRVALAVAEADAPELVSLTHAATR